MHRTGIFIVAAGALVASPAAAGEAYYSTYLGGSGQEYVTDAVVDRHGNLYLVGITGSPDFPGTAGAFDASYDGPGHPDGRFDDAFVAKLDPLGGLVWATYLGGSAYDAAYGVAVDDAGNVAVTGFTRSADFPTTEGAPDRELIDSSYDGGPPYYDDAFIVKLGPDGEVAWSTLYGHDLHEKGFGVALGLDGSVTIGGSGTPGDELDSMGMIVRFRPEGSVEYVRYLPEHGRVEDVAVDALGRTFATAQAWDAGRRLDAHVVRLSAGGTREAETTLGGAGDDSPDGLAVGLDGDVYLVGFTSSPDFAGAPAGELDALVVRLSPGLDVRWARRFGGPDWDRALAVAVDALGGAVVIGGTYGGGIFARPEGPDQDAFVAHFDPAGELLEVATIGAPGDGVSPEDGHDVGMGGGIDAAGNLYLAGPTGSPDFPLSPGAFDRRYERGEAFAVKLARGPGEADDGDDEDGAGDEQDDEDVLGGEIADEAVAGRPHALDRPEAGRGCGVTGRRGDGAGPTLGFLLGGALAATVVFRRRRHRHA